MGSCPEVGVPEKGVWLQKGSRVLCQDGAAQAEGDSTEQRVQSNLATEAE